MPDGTYEVLVYYPNGDRMCAYFVVENGKVTRCAPILLRKLSYWMTVARSISDV